MALGVGLAVILLSWLLYDAAVDAAGRSTGHRRSLSSLLLVGGIAQGLAEFMTGRAVFIHLGALLGSIMVNNTHQRPQRVAHNAVHRTGRRYPHDQQSLPAHLRRYARLARGTHRRVRRVPHGRVVRMDVEARARSSG